MEIAMQLEKILDKYLIRHFLGTEKNVVSWSWTFPITKRGNLSRTDYCGDGLACNTIEMLSIQPFRPWLSGRDSPGTWG